MAVKLPSSDGTDPVKRLLSNRSYRRLLRLPSSVAMVPTRAFRLNWRDVREVRYPISLWKSSIQTNLMEIECCDILAEIALYTFPKPGVCRGRLATTACSSTKNIGGYSSWRRWCCCRAPLAPDAAAGVSCRQSTVCSSSIQSRGSTRRNRPSDH